VVQVHQDPDAAKRVALTQQTLKTSKFRAKWCRFIKIPMRPVGTEGWSEERLRELINRDCLVGVSHPRSPGSLPQQTP